MNPKIPKLADEIDKLKRKIAEYQSRLRDMEKQKTDLENADIIAMVRGVDIPPEQLAEFARMFMERQNCAVPEAVMPKTAKETNATQGSEAQSSEVQNNAADE